ncbi:MAG: DUF3703 domain-containing protein [Acidobacteria bacterium]|nr:DUF3703 domain-containing protein [Acidobacteriota bacterium]
MTPKLKLFFDEEMNKAILLIKNNNLKEGFYHLERAHILGQKYVIPHIKTHWWMLKVGLMKRSLAEIFGQAIRIIFGALGSAIGVVPIGNTGGANVNMFSPMPIAKDLELIISSSET